MTVIGEVMTFWVIHLSLCCIGKCKKYIVINNRVVDPD
jgi:hypothetical protein